MAARLIPTELRCVTAETREYLDSIGWTVDDFFESIKQSQEYNNGHKRT